MKKLTLIIAIVFSGMLVQSQNISEENLTKKVDSLQGLINDNIKLIDSISTINNSLLNEQGSYQVFLDKIYVEKLVGSYYICKAGTVLYKTPNNWWDKLSSIKRGDKVKVTEVLDKQYRVYYKGLYGYVSQSGFVSEKEYFDELKEKEELEKTHEQQRLLKLKKTEEQTRLVNEKRKKEIIEIYGIVIGTKIIDKKIWLGMTDKMARESRGTPDDINRTVNSSGVREQWVYPYRNYLYFENGILTSWQD